MVNWSENTLSQIELLVACFGVYILLIFLFATIYYYPLYKRQRKSFIFQQEIILGRKEEIENRIRDLKPEIEVLQNLVEELKQGKDIEHLVAEKSHTLMSGNRYQISKRIVSDCDSITGVTTDYTVIDLDIQNSLGNIVGRMVFESPGYDKFKEHLLYREKNLADYQKQLKTIGDYSPDIWSYWDFFYFSASTQTTLGHGDILPNSTLVRLLVIVQVFFGLAIIVLLINFVILIFR